MKLKLINSTFSIQAYMSEIMTPDRRFRSGKRPTGKFEAKSNVEVTLRLEYNEIFQIRDVITTNELGQFMIVAVNKLDNAMDCICVKMNAFEHRFFNVQGYLDVAVIARPYGEGNH